MPRKLVTPSDAIDAEIANVATTSKSMKDSRYKDDKEAVWRFVLLNNDNYYYASDAIKADKRFWINVIMGQEWQEFFPSKPPPAPNVVVAHGFPNDPDYLEAARAMVERKKSSLLQITNGKLYAELTAPESSLVAVDSAFVSDLVTRLARESYDTNQKYADYVAGQLKRQWHGMAAPMARELQTAMLADENIVFWLVRYCTYKTTMWRTLDEGMKGNAQFTKALVLAMCQDVRGRSAETTSTEIENMSKNILRFLSRNRVFKWNEAPNEEQEAVCLDILSQCPAYVISNLEMIAQTRDQSNIPSFYAWTHTVRIARTLFTRLPDQPARDALIEYYEDTDDQWSSTDDKKAWAQVLQEQVGYEGGGAAEDRSSKRPWFSPAACFSHVLV